MSDGYNYDRSDLKQHYSGVPHQQTETEKSTWRKFLETVFPWLKQKWELGEQYLEARVRREQATASNQAAEAQLKMAQTQKVKLEAQREMLLIAEQAAKLEQQKLESSDIKPSTEKELQAEVERVAEFLNLLKIKYGLEIQVNIGNATDQLRLDLAATMQSLSVQHKHMTLEHQELAAEHKQQMHKWADLIKRTKEGFEDQDPPTPAV